MSRQPPKEAPGVALFPFLAVLICTMGALILLLVAIARQAKVQAERAAVAALPKVAQSRFEAELVQLRIDALRSDRDIADAELLKHRSILQQIEVRYRELSDQLAELEAAKANLLQLMAGENNSPHRAELARLQGRIINLKGKLAEVRAKGAAQKPSFAIVPYAGPNGTRRRPLYIECRADSLVLQPEGIEFTEDDFAGPLGPGNPLAAGLRAAVEHVNRNRRAATGDTGEAYPLLLIRPDGINAYYAARAALKSWGSDFGYELVDGDWQLDFGRPDPQLANVERRAVDDAREKQQLADGFGSGGYGGKPFRGKYRVGANGGLVRIDGDEQERPSFRANPAGGGLVQERGSRSAGSRGFGSASVGKPATTSSGSRSGSYFTQKSNNQLSGTDSESGKPSTSPTGTGQSNPQGNSPRTTGNAFAGAAGTGTGGSSQSASNGGSPGMGQPGQPSDGAMASDRQMPQIMPQQMFGQRENAQSPGGGSATESLAKSRGKDWGLPNIGRGSFPITRPIRIQCYDNRLVLLPDSPNAPAAKEIPLGPRTSDSVDDLVAAVWEHIDAWGIAGKGMYWRPILHAEATPDGAARLSDLKILLAGSGLTVHDKSLEASRPAVHR